MKLDRPQLIAMIEKHLHILDVMVETDDEETVKVEAGFCKGLIVGIRYAGELVEAEQDYYLGRVHEILESLQKKGYPFMNAPNSILKTKGS